MPASAEERVEKDLADKVKAYESKIATLTIIYGAVQKENETLRADLKQAEQPGGVTGEEVLQLKEEFTRRLGAADQTVARLQDEKERLKGCLTAASQDSHTKCPQLQERHIFIASLQEEGLSLAKRNSELEGTARRLKAAARASEVEHQKVQSRVQQLEAELAREQDRYSQASQAAGEQLEELEAQLESSMADSERQVAAAQQQAAEAVKRAEALAAKGSAQALAVSMERVSALSRSLADLRSEMEVGESSWAARENTLRREVARLQAHIHNLESEKAELAVSASEATKPLLRQVESMAAAAAEQQRSAQHLELSFIAQLKQVKLELAAASEAAKAATSQAEAAEAAACSAKQGLSMAHAMLHESKSKFHTEQQRSARLQEEYDALDSRLKVQSAAADSTKQNHQRQHLEMQTQIQKLQQQLKDLTLEHQQLKEKHDSLQSGMSAYISQPSGRPSMLGGVKAILQKLNGSQQHHRQLPISVPSLVIGQHLGVDTPPHSAQTASSAAAFKQDPQAILQQPQGNFNALEGISLQPVTENVAAAEVAESSGQQEDDWDALLRSMSNGKHTAWKNGTAEAARIANLERRLLTSEAAEQRVHVELLKACEGAEAAERHAVKIKQLQEQLQEQGQRYDTALELLGERNERVDQLDEDVKEMKQIFHEQISMMADQLNQARQIQSHALA